MRTGTRLKDRCENEDECGRRCGYGPGHRLQCNFRPIRWTDPQVKVLTELAFWGVRKYQGPGTSQVATLKALANRGLIGLRYVNSRAWDAWILPAGNRVVIDLPR